MKKLVAAIAIPIGGAVALAAWRRMTMRDALSQVAPDLRHPVLPFVPATDSARLLPLYRMNSPLFASSEAGVTVTNRRVPSETSVPVRVTKPAGISQDARAAVLWIHGGGYVVGSPKMEGFASDRLVREVGVVAVSPEYRLAPEHPFPAALDDCMATLRWMRAEAADLGIDPERIAVIGASAGGGLAAAVAQRSHDEGLTLRTQVLMYPMLDDRTALLSGHGGRGQFVWTASSNRFGWTSYLGRPPRVSDAPAYAAPARREDLTRLPPAWIGVGEIDLLHDENVAYAERLRSCGVPCELLTVPGMYHGADALAPKALAIREFRRSFLTHLRTYL